MRRHLIAFGSVLGLTAILAGTTRESRFVMGDLSGPTRVERDILIVASSSRSLLSSVAREPSGEVDGAYLSLKMENDRFIVEVKNRGSRAVELEGSEYSYDTDPTREEAQLPHSSLKVYLYQGTTRWIEPRSMCGNGLRRGYASLLPSASIQKKIELRSTAYRLVSSPESVIQASIRFRDGRELYSNILAFPVYPDPSEEKS